ncbi:alpha/beta hydrolase [Thalassococcus sp. CAU 1522]|uniref:Alpha/beta hydrolase n=1 Tax=Thalassococcus arenae TaxID=2851652 RepID=A0ABS6N3A5_9RHOB|nr:alpha/beta hydrolase [Thalassococcus arenae]MBV2358505.1 alpha/beta hydrolase [Thalassococcus arenae]
MKRHVFFDGALLNGTLFNPGQSRLFVSFRQRIGDPGNFEKARAVHRYAANGFTHLHLQSRWNDWYVNAETPALERALEAFSAQFESVCAMGFSMGGYAALRLAGPLRLCHLLAISPQYSIAKVHVPFDRRYRAEARGWDAEAGDLACRGTDVRGAVLIDPFRPLDLANAELIAAAFPNLTVVRLPCGGHPATRALRQGGKLGWLQDQLAQGVPDPRAIGRSHRAVRRDSESYWRHLQALAKHRGRSTLAETARKQARRIAAKSAGAGLDGGAAEP